MPSEPYDVRYADEAVKDLRAMRAFDQRAVLEGIEIHLLLQPKYVSKSRIKLMNQPSWSQYRLRVGDFRIYYDVDDDPVTTLSRWPEGGHMIRASMPLRKSGPGR